MGQLVPLQLGRAAAGGAGVVEGGRGEAGRREPQLPGRGRVRHRGEAGRRRHRRVPGGAHGAGDGLHFIYQQDSNEFVFDFINPELDK